MTDLLVNLLEIEDYKSCTEQLKKEGIDIFRAITPDKLRVVEWVKEHSGPSAAGECDTSFARIPVSCFIAAKADKIIGYACYNATAPDFFGPTRVLDEYQGKGIGKALLLRSLYAMREEGYQYAIIGGAGPVSFYEKCAGAVVIESSKRRNVYEHFLAMLEHAKNDQ